MNASQLALRPTARRGNITAGDVGHTFEFAEWKACLDQPPTSTPAVDPRTVTAGTSSLYRHLRMHPHSSTALLEVAAADVAHRLRTGRERAEDGDELAEVCFRAAGRAGLPTRDAHLGLAAALLAHCAGWNVPAGGVTTCASCDAPVHSGHWLAAIQSCTHPEKVRTVAR